MDAAIADPSTLGNRRSPVNSRQQDLFLLAKNHYRVDGIARPELARLLVGLHNLGAPLELSWSSAAICTVNDLVGSVLTLEGDHLRRFLIEMGPSLIDRMLGRPDRFAEPGGYYAVLIEQVLSDAAMTLVLRNQEWLMPFPKPTADPWVQARLETVASQLQPA